MHADSGVRRGRSSGPPATADERDRGGAEKLPPRAKL